MESMQQAAARKICAQAYEIIIAPVAKLRDPNHESTLARFHKSGAPTATMAYNRLIFSLIDHHENGGIIVTAKGAVLDVERMETRGEQFVYDTRGRIVHLDDGLPLRRPEDSFGASPRRTMNRLFEKAETPSTQCVDRRLLSMMFWADASQKIMERK